jgi:DNA invertase Pin-like site-specific DNA recombinase
MISERVTTGLARAKKHGTRSGNPISRPRNGSERTAGQVLRLRRQGWGLTRIGREPKIGAGTVQRILTERG